MEWKLLMSNIPTRQEEYRWNPFCPISQLVRKSMNGNSFCAVSHLVSKRCYTLFIMYDGPGSRRRNGLDPRVIEEEIEWLNSKLLY